MKNGLGRDVNAGLKPLAQYVEALRADERVGFNRLPRTEAGIYPADSSFGHPPPRSARKVVNGLYNGQAD